MFVETRDDMYGVDAAILMNPKAWEASGHVAGFADPLADGKSFNTMFKTSVGAGEEALIAYLRPETAGGIFVNFKNTVDSMHPKLPFGIAQTGKAFRNEIAPIDFEFDYPFGRKELWGLAYRGDFDLSAHEAGSGVSLAYLDEENKEKIIPHVIEPSLGVDRTILAILVSAYCEDELGGERRTYLALAPRIAPVKAAVFPLLKNKPELVAKAREVFTMLKKN